MEFFKYNITKLQEKGPSNQQHEISTNFLNVFILTNAA